MGAVIAFRKDLLGSRLLNFMYAWQFAQLFGRELFLIWPDETPYSLGSYSFYDLFSEAMLNESGFPVRIIKTYELDQIAPIIGVGTDVLEAMPEASNALVNGPDWHLSADSVWYRSTAPIFKLSNMPGTQDVASLFRSLPYQGAVAKALDEFTDVDLSQCLAVHMRRGSDIIDTYIVGDNRYHTGLFLPISSTNSADKRFTRKRILHFINKYAPMSSIARVAAEIQTSSALKGIVLFSDVSEDREEMKAILSENVVDIHGPLDRNLDLTPLQRAFCELVLISRCPKIVGSRSNFCVSASILGGSKLFYVQSYMKAEEIIRDVEMFLKKTELSQADRTILFRAILEGYHEFFGRQHSVQAAEVYERMVADGN